MKKEDFFEVSVEEKPNAETNSDWENFELKDYALLEQVKGKQQRSNWRAKATHLLAYIIVIPFVVCIIYQILLRPEAEVTMPVYFISIVSTIIGFYFAGKFKD